MPRIISTGRRCIKVAAGFIKWCTRTDHLPSFSSVIQNRYRQHTSTTHRPQRYNIQPIQQKLLYIGINTINVIKEEVLALGLPATLANISLAIQSSEKVLNAFVNGAPGPRVPQSGKTGKLRLSF